MVNNILGSFLVSLAVSFLVIPLIIAVLRRKNLVDSPDRRKIHKGSIPSMGGIGIFIGMGVAMLIWLTLNGIVQYKYILAGATLLFITGVRDDLLPISARVKLIVQMFSATIIIGSGIMVSSDYGLFGIEALNITIRIFLSLGFIIFFTNSFNLIDGLDGLAGTVAVIISVAFGSWFFLNQDYYLAILAAGIAGGTVGFIYYNWQPARIFMGDTGALTLGFLFSVLAIAFMNQDYALASGYHKINAPISMMMAVLFVPIFDTFRIIVVRLVKRRSPFEPDKNHTHHVLMRLGLKHRHVAMLLGLVNISVITLVFLLRRFNDNIVLPSLILFGFALSVVLDQLIIHQVRTKARFRRNRLKAKREKVVEEVS